MLSPESLTLVLGMCAAMSVCAVVYALVHPFLSGEKQAQKRLEIVTTSRSSKIANAAAAENTAHRRKAVADSLRDIEERQQETKKVSLRLRLQRAGLKISVKTYWVMSVIVGALLAVAVLLSMEWSPLTFLAAGIAGFVGVFGLPRWWIARKAKKRQKKFLKEMANAVDVVVRGVKSGLPLNECLQIIARESPEPICSEFKEVVEQQRAGVPLPETLDRLMGRVPLPEVKFLAIVISIQQQAGGNLSEALGNLSGVLRDRIKMQMKVQALSSEAKAGAYVLGALPPTVMGLVYLTTPGYIMPLFTHKVGHMILLVGALSMFMGIMVMKKMINFKF